MSRNTAERAYDRGNDILVLMDCACSNAYVQVDLEEADSVLDDYDEALGLYEMFLESALSIGDMDEVRQLRRDITRTKVEKRRYKKELIEKRYNRMEKAVV